MIVHQRLEEKCPLWTRANAIPSLAGVGRPRLICYESVFGGDLRRDLSIVYQMIPEHSKTCQETLSATTGETITVASCVCELSESRRLFFWDCLISSCLAAPGAHSPLILLLGGSPAFLLGSATQGPVEPFGYRSPHVGSIPRFKPPLHVVLRPCRRLQR